MKAVDDTTQWRYPGGYRWISGDQVVDQMPQGEQILSTGLPAGSCEFVRYRPPPNLFLTFANTAPTSVGIKDFADGYGLLGLPDQKGSVLLRLGDTLSDRSAPAALGSGEQLSAWQRQIKAMRHATNLWSSLTQANSGEPTILSKQVKWLGDKLVYYDSHPHLPRPLMSYLLLGLPPGPESVPPKEDREEDELRVLAVIASKRINQEWLRLFRPGDPVMPARYYLQKSVNEQLKGQVSPRLLWNVRRNRPYDLNLYFVPDNLLGLMWLQLAEAINGNKQFRQCAACKTWMVISTDLVGSRSNRVTCSNACRMKVYYGRKLTARRLQQQGLSFRQIAKSLGAKEASVRDWIGLNKRSKSRT